MKIKGPMRSIFYPHKAIITELGILKDLTEKLALNSDFNELEDRVNFLSDVVNVHAKSEEDVFYPAVDELRKDISKVFIWDHELDEKYFQAIKESMAKLKGGGKQIDLENLNRNVCALSATLSAHAKKEDDLLVPLIDEEIDPMRQGEMVGKIVAHIPPHMMERVFKWIVSIISSEERADFIGIMKKGMPPERFDVVKGWTKEILSENEWKELLSRIS